MAYKYVILNKAMKNKHASCLMSQCPSGWMFYSDAEEQTKTEELILWQSFQ
jgi:hypothetical protein